MAPSAPQGRKAKQFWDARAKEDPLFFVDDRVAYGNADEAQFWADGERDLNAVLDAVGSTLASGSDVLEIGCGVGRLTRVIAPRVAHVRAVDVSPRMLALAQRHNPGLNNVEWIEGDGTSLAGTTDASVDTCLSHVVFQHIPDPSITLGYVREMGRVLRPGGWAGFQVSNAREVHLPPARRLRLRSLVGRAPRGLGHPNWRGSSVEISAVRAAANDGAMDVEQITGEGTQFCMIRTRKR